MAALTATVPSWTADSVLRLPWRLPIGVRAAEAMKISWGVKADWRGDASGWGRRTVEGGGGRARVEGGVGQPQRASKRQQRRDGGTHHGGKRAGGEQTTGGRGEERAGGGGGRQRQQHLARAFSSERARRAGEVVRVGSRESCDRTREMRVGGRAGRLSREGWDGQGQRGQGGVLGRVWVWPSWSCSVWVMAVGREGRRSDRLPGRRPEPDGKPKTGSRQTLWRMTAIN